MSETEIDYNTVDSFELDNHLVLLKKNASRVQMLNPLAKMIWQSKKTGLSSHDIARDISEVFDIPIELALQDVISINTQLMLDLVTKPEEISPPKKTIPFDKELSNWRASLAVFYFFPGFTVKINFDSQEIADKVKRMFPHITGSNTKVIDVELDVISKSDVYLIVKEGVVVEQAESKSYTALMVFHHVVDLASKSNNWLAILHAAGVSWKGNSIIFPALGGSGKTTLTAALIKQGFDYINDDVIPLIRDTGELIHLPISLSIKSGSWPLLQSLYPELESLEVFGSQERRIKYLPPPRNSSEQAVYAKNIILPNYKTGVTAKLESVSPAMALQAIIEGESLFRLPLKKQDVAALIYWIKPLGCYRLTYDKLESAVDLLQQFCLKNYQR
ncbi:MAG: PqqD family protein [Methylococcaceae bacterium]|nr:PqqD family protein [Methylococcaceae bacterium]